MLTDLYGRLTRAAPPMETNHPSFIPKSLIPKAILEGAATGTATKRVHHPGEPVRPLQVPGRRLFQDPHDLDRFPLVDHLLERRQRLHPGRAHPDIEFIAGAAPLAGERLLSSPTSSCRSTPSSKKTTSAATSSAGRSNLCSWRSKCIEPLGESFSDYEIVCRIAERLGLLEEYTGGKTVAELIRLGYETSGRAGHDQLGGTATRRATT